MWFLFAVHCSSEIASTGQHLFGLDSHIMDERNRYISDEQANSNDSRSMSKAIDKCPSDLSEYHQAATGNVPDLTDQLHSDRHGCEFQTTIDACHVNSEESDLFKKHFSSLSSTHKVCNLHVYLVELKLSEVLLGWGVVVLKSREISDQLLGTGL